MVKKFLVCFYAPQPRPEALRLHKLLPLTQILPLVNKTSRLDSEPAVYRKILESRSSKFIYLSIHKVLSKSINHK